MDELLGWLGVIIITVAVCFFVFVIIMGGFVVFFVAAIMIGTICAIIAVADFISFVFKKGKQ